MRITNKSINLTNLNEAGMASILVTLIMSVVITLVVIGFAQVSTREQQNALQNQLSTTAFYAAETGVNDAISVINQNSGSSDLTKTSCGAPTDPTSPYAQLYSGNLAFTNSNSQSGSKYTCLLVNPAPVTLTYAINSDSQVIPINPSQSPYGLIFTWQGSGNWDPTQCSGNGITLGTATSWTCKLTALRFDLVPITSSLDESTLASNVESGVVLPYATADDNCTSSPQLQVDIQGSSAECNDIFGSTCTTTSGCRFDIYLPNSSYTSYYLRISTLYPGSDTLNVSATNGDTLLSLTGAEYVIDSTGVANGVAKRIQVAIPVANNSGFVPGYAIQSTNDVCKRFYIIPNSPSVPNALGDQLGVPRQAISDFLSPLPNNDCQNGY